MSDDIDNRLIDYDDNYREYDVTDITWVLGTDVPYLVDDGDVLAIVIVPTADGEQLPNSARWYYGEIDGVLPSAYYMETQVLITEQNYDWIKSEVTRKRRTYYLQEQDVEDLTHDIIIQILEDKVATGKWGATIIKVLNRNKQRILRNKEKTRIPNEVL